MIKRKLTTISIIFTLFFTGLVQIVNSEQLHTEKESEYNEVGYPEGWDIVITSFDKLEYKGYEKIDDESYAIYDVEYSITNVGDMIFEGGTTTWIRSQQSTIAFAAWDDIGILEPGETKNFTHEVKIPTSDEINDESYVQEKHFADHDIIIGTCSGEGPIEPGRNLRRAKYWNDELDYIPTLAHLLVSTPWRFKNHTILINQEEVYYLELNKIDSLPSILKENYLGWIKELLEYLNTLNEDIHQILIVDDEMFVQNAWVYIKNVNNWTERLCNSFKNLIDNINASSRIKTLFNQFQDINRDFILPLKELGDFEEIEKIIEDSNNFQNWINTKPWMKPINISVEIEGVKDNETISITCRNSSFYFKDEDDGKEDGRVYANITVPPKIEDDEESYFPPLDSRVFVEGDRHKRLVLSRGIEPLCIRIRNVILKSDKLFSYCFSNGSFSVNFTEEDWNKSSQSQSKIIQFILKLLDWLKNRPFFKLIYKFLDRLNADEKEERESDEGYIYKPYHSGVSFDNPHVVYYDENQVIVRFNRDVSDIEYVNGCPVLEHEEEFNVVLVDVTGVDPNDFIRDVKKRDDVLEAELNIIGTGCDTDPTDEHWDKQWGNRAILCDKAWDYATGLNVKIAMLDSGLDFNHEDIEPWRCSSQYDYVNEDDNATDDLGHGTHCIDLVMGAHNEVGIAGVAPKAEIIPIKVLDENNIVKYFDLVQGLIHASLKRAKIICVPMSINAPKVEILEAVIDAIAYDHLIVASVGNFGDMTRISLPARYEEVVAVGSVGWDDDTNGDGVPNPEELYVSSKNQKGGGRIVDLVAPGEQIFSALPGNNYGYKSGSS
ncbi:MAG: hypothetical protein DRN24_07040, partial [Thermoplasmata archaeon]